MSILQTQTYTQNDIDCLIMTNVAIQYVTLCGTLYKLLIYFYFPYSFFLYTCREIHTDHKTCCLKINNVYSIPPPLFFNIVPVSPSPRFLPLRSSTPLPTLVIQPHPPRSQSGSAAGFRGNYRMKVKRIWFYLFPTEYCLCTYIRIS